MKFVEHKGMHVDKFMCNNSYGIDIDNSSYLIVREKTLRTHTYMGIELASSQYARIHANMFKTNAFAGIDVDRKR